MAKRRPKEFGVVVRFDNGSRLFLKVPTTSGDEWTPSESAARRFASEDEARRHAASCVVNSKAKEYLVAPLRGK